jgi:hypothetical protein
VSYEWQITGISSPVTFTGNGSTSINITSPVTANGTVAVRALGCGATVSPYRSVNVTVAPAQPGTITYYVDGSPGTTCIGTGGNHAVTLSVPAVSGATGYTWTIPAGWTAPGLVTTDPTITVTTNASTAGVVSVSAGASACWGTTRAITLQRSGLSFCVNVAAFGPFNQYSVSGLPGAATDYIYTWRTQSGVQFTGDGFSTIFQNMVSPPVTAMFVDIVAKSNSGCPTTLSLRLTPGQDCTPAGLGLFSSGNSATRATGFGEQASRSSTSGEEKLLSVYPNPATHDVNIAVAAQVSDAVAQVYSTNGKLITTLRGANSFAVDVSDYANGTYFVILTSSVGMRYQKFIVKH